MVKPPQGFGYRITDPQGVRVPTPPPPPRCPYCDRVMSTREHDEQGACNDCYDASLGQR